MAVGSRSRPCQQTRGSWQSWAPEQTVVRFWPPALLFISLALKYETCQSVLGLCLLHGCMHPRTKKHTDRNAHTLARRHAHTLKTPPHLCPVDTRKASHGSSEEQPVVHHDLWWFPVWETKLQCCFLWSPLTTQGAPGKPRSLPKWPFVCKHSLTAAPPRPPPILEPQEKPGKLSH